MSLESQLAELTQTCNKLVEYFNTKKAGIDAALAAAIAAAPAMSRTWYVDQVAGSDANAGTKDAPFKTFEKAANSTPATGVCNINLMGDYTFTTLVRSSCAFILVSGAEATVQPKIYLKYMDSGTSSGSTELAGFLLTGQSANIGIRKADLAFPSTAGATKLTATLLCSFIRTNQRTNLPPMLGVSLEGLAVTMDATFYGALIGNSTSSVCLNANEVTFPSGFGGKYISTVAAGVDPKTLNNVLTNLPSL
ncbi:TPA: hypothetical protein ACNV18_001481 [Pseudomonas putida]